MIILTILTLLTGVNKAAAIHSDVNLSQQSVTVNLALELTENFTTLPPLNISLQNPPEISKPIEAAIQKRVLGASLQFLQLQAKTSVLNPGTSQLRENYTITVRGASSNTGGMISTNLAFLSMNMSDSITIGGAELNSIGSTYLLQPLKNIPGNPTTAYFFNGAAFRNTVIPGVNTNKFRLLDFTWIPAVADWSRTDDILNQASRWDLNSQTNNLFQGGAPFNLTVGLTKHEATYLPVYEAVFDPSLDVTVPTVAWAQGNIAYFDLPTPFENIAPAILMGLLAIAVLSYVLDRRLTGRVIPKRKKR
jgi:hypothetical protein